MQQYIPFLAILAPFVLFFNQTKQFLLRLFKMLWKTRELVAKVGLPFYKELQQYKCYDFDNYTPVLFQVFDKQTSEIKSVISKSTYHEIYFYKGFIPVSVSDGSKGIQFSYIKYTFPFEKLLSNIVKTIQPDIYQTYHYIQDVRGSKKEMPFSTIESSPPRGHGLENSGPKLPILQYSCFDIIDQGLGKLIGDDVNKYLCDKPKQSITKYIFTKQGNRIKDQVMKWKASESWYEQRNVRYYRGLLLKSDPGMGKSALIHEIAKQANLPLFILDLSSFDNKELCAKLKEMDCCKGILLIEDIDCQWNGRENLNKTDFEKGVTFDCFLNRLSGADAIKNKFVFLTSNHAYKLDDAIIRPGRIDEIVELESLNLEEKRQVAEIIVGDSDIVEELLKDSDGDSTAGWENKCVTAALSKFWQKD